MCTSSHLSCSEITPCISVFIINMWSLTMHSSGVACFFGLNFLQCLWHQCNAQPRTSHGNNENTAPRIKHATESLNTSHIFHSKHIEHVSGWSFPRTVTCLCPDSVWSSVSLRFLHVSIVAASFAAFFCSRLVCLPRPFLLLPGSVSFFVPFSLFLCVCV